jgi:hypothetical protein
MGDAPRGDDWSADGAKITAPETLDELRKTLEAGELLVVEHRHYRGASAPTRFFCDNFEDLTRYLENEARSGDSIWIWKYDAVCTDTNALVHGKKPDAEGRTPRGGAY